MTAATDERRFRLTVERTGQARAQEPVRLTCDTLAEAVSHARDTIRAASGLHSSRLHGASEMDRDAYVAQMGACLREIESWGQDGGRSVLPNGTALTITPVFPHVVVVAFASWAPDGYTAREETIAQHAHAPGALYVGDALDATAETLDGPSLSARVIDYTDGEPNGHELRRATEWRLVAQWGQDAGSAYGDAARGTARVSLYRRGDHRVEIAYYPTVVRVGDDAEEYGVDSCAESWTVDYRDGGGHDYGRDAAEIDYHPENALAFENEAQAQRYANDLGSLDEAWKLG